MRGINHFDETEFGKIVDDWRCCNPSLEIFSENKSKKYKITGTCCQCALICPVAAMCNDVKFFIYEHVFSYLIQTSNLLN